jgi:hypothetical protein
MTLDGELRLFETWSRDGRKLETYLRIRNGLIEFDEPEQTTEMPLRVLEAVFRRYGRPLELEIAPVGPRLQLSDSVTIMHFRYLARFDVIAKDYLVWIYQERETLAELATGIVAALSHIAAVPH